MKIFGAKNSKDGFGIVELIVVVSIVALLAVFSYAAFFSRNESEGLEKDAGTVVALLERARSLTLSSKGATRYGVYFESGRAVLFSGNSFVDGAPGNITETINQKIEISSIAIAGGPSVIFDRLTGKTTNPGVIEISLVSDPNIKKTVTILSTGLVEEN